MALTPDQIVNYELKQAVRGYSMKQVDDLLDRVADELERHRAEAADLRERLARAEAALAGASETEQTLKRTLVTAQRAAEQALEDARVRAAELLDEAEREAEATTDQAYQDAEELRHGLVDGLRAEAAQLERRRVDLRADIQALHDVEADVTEALRDELLAQLRRIEEFSQRPRPAPPSVPPAERPPEEAEVEGGVEAGPAERELGAEVLDVEEVEDPQAAFSVHEAPGPAADDEPDGADDDEPLTWLHEVTGAPADEPPTDEIPTVPSPPANDEDHDELLFGADEAAAPPDAEDEAFEELFDERVEEEPSGAPRPPDDRP